MHISGISKTLYSMPPFPETIPSWFCIAVQQVCFWPFWPFPAQRLFSLDSSVVSNKAAINGLSCPTNPTPGQQKNCRASLWASYHYQMDNAANAKANGSSVSFSSWFKIHIHSTLCTWVLKTRLIEKKYPPFFLMPNFRKLQDDSKNVSLKIGSWKPQKSGPFSHFSSWEKHFPVDKSGFWGHISH